MKGTINRYLKISGIVVKYYKKLYELEISGKKNTKEYSDTINNLKIAISVEKDVYNSTDLSYDSAIKYGNFLFSENPCKEHTEALFEENYEHDLERRIIGHFEMFDVKKLVEAGIAIETLKSFGEIVTQEQQTITYFDSDYYKRFLIYLNEYIKKPEYSQIKGRMIRAKYFLSLVNKDIEEDLLENNFDLIENDCSMLKMYLLINTNKKDINTEIDAIGELEVEKITYRLNTENDSIIGKIFELCFLKSALSIISNNSLIKCIINNNNTTNENIKKAFFDIISLRKGKENKSGDKTKRFRK